MDRRLFGLALACAGVAPLALAEPGNKLRVVTSHLPPLVMEGGDRPGALHELVLELGKRLLLTPALEFVPWRRATFLATTMPATAIFPLTRLPAREAQYRWLAPLFEEHYVFLALRGGAFDVRHPDRMTARRIALIRGAAQAGVLAELGFTNLVEAASVEEVHRFLVGGMADAAFGERVIVRSSLQRRGAEDDFQLSAPVRSSTAWLAGSLDFSEAEAARYRRAMAAMVADGTQQRILRKYGLA